jgi:hypothetical protein
MRSREEEQEQGGGGGVEIRAKNTALDRTLDAALAVISRNRDTAITILYRVDGEQTRKNR